MFYHKSFYAKTRSEAVRITYFSGNFQYTSLLWSQKSPKSTRMHPAIQTQITCYFSKNHTKTRSERWELRVFQRNFRLRAFLGNQKESSRSEVVELRVFHENRPKNT